MTNREKFGETLINMLAKQRLFSIKNGKPRLCRDVVCSDCDIAGNCAEGFKKWLDSEYEPKINWSKVPIDTKILVRDCSGTLWSRRYFSGIDKNGAVTTWEYGNTSWSANINNKICWKYAKLAIQEDIDKYSV